MPSFDGERLPVFVYQVAPPPAADPIAPPWAADPIAPPPAAAAPPPAPATPVVLVIHGGPEGQSVLGFNPVVQGLAASGYALVVPNVRGSVGYGKRYAALDDTTRRLDSVADLAAIHDWLPSQGFDPSRAVLWGGSYGGYMVLAGCAFQPERWAAGVDIVGISDLVTFLENTSAYRRSHREREYGSLNSDRAFLEAASPLRRVDHMRAPLFVIHGANDPRVPLSEAEQLVASLTSRGVPCELVVYADEGHGLARLANQLDAYPRAVEFLRRCRSQRRRGRPPLSRRAQRPPVSRRASHATVTGHDSFVAAGSENCDEKLFSNVCPASGCTYTSTSSREPKACWICSTSSAGMYGSAPPKWKSTGQEILVGDVEPAGDAGAVVGHTAGGIRRHGQLVGEAPAEAVAHCGDEAGDFRQPLQVVEGGGQVGRRDGGIDLGESLGIAEGRPQALLVVRQGDVPLDPPEDVRAENHVALACQRMCAVLQELAHSEDLLQQDDPGSVWLLGYDRECVVGAVGRRDGLGSGRIGHAGQTSDRPTGTTSPGGRRGRMPADSRLPSTRCPSRAQPKSKSHSRRRNRRPRKAANPVRGRREFP